MGLTKSKQKSRDDLKSQIQEFNDRLQVALVGSNQAKVTFITLSDLWMGSRDDVLLTLNHVADEIDRHHRNVNIASMTGTTSSIAGGTAAIAGLVLSPFTGGLSTALAAGGLVGTVAGSATTLGATIAEVLITNELIERAKVVLNTDEVYTRALCDAFRELIVHEQEVLSILAELKNEVLLEDLEKVVKSSPCSDEVKKRFYHFRDRTNSLEDIMGLVKCLYPDDHEFLQQLSKTDSLFSTTPSFSSTISSSSEFLQALKELATAGPETLRAVGGAALQSTAASGQMVSLGTQLITASLGAVFVALDILQFIKTSRNYDHGSKTELALKIRNVVGEFEKEKEQAMKLSDFYKQQIKFDSRSTTMEKS